MTIARITQIAISLAVLTAAASASVVFAQPLIPNTKVALMSPVIVVSEEVDRTSLYQGDAFLLTVTIRNIGEVSVSSVSVRDVLPSGFTLVTSGSSEYSYKFTNPVAPGNEVTTMFAVRTDQNLQPGIYYDAVTVTAASADPIETNAAFTVLEQSESTKTVTSPEQGDVLGAETTLAESGVEQLDVFMMLLGSFLVGGGVIGLRSVDRTAIPRRNHPA